MAFDNYGRSTYGGGGAQTSAYGPASPYEGTNATDALQALINAERGSGGAGPRRVPSDRFPRSRPTLGGGNAEDDRLAAAERRARILQLQAASRPAATRPMADLGNTSAGVFTMDPGAMNAYQRQLFLPQSSQAESPAVEAQAAAVRGDDERAADEAFRALVQRRRATDALGGGPSYGGVR